MTFSKIFLHIIEFTQQSIVKVLKKAVFPSKTKELAANHILCIDYTEFLQTFNWKNNITQQMKPMDNPHEHKNKRG